MTKANFFGKDAEFDHVGFAVRSIQQVVKGACKTEDPIQDVNVSFLDVHGLTMELVEPISESSPVSKLLEKGQSIYHVCFRVPNIQAAMTAAREHGFHCIAKPVPARAFKNKNIAWLFSKTYGLIELMESS